MRAALTGISNARSPAVAELGDVDVQDITFHAQVTEDEDDLTMTVYYTARTT